MHNKEERRDVVRARRRARRFVSILRGDQQSISELRERRPPDAPVQQIISVPTEGVHASDSVTQADVVDPIFTWSEDKWKETEWGDANV